LRHLVSCIRKEEEEKKQGKGRGRKAKKIRPGGFLPGCGLGRLSSFGFLKGSFA